MKKHARNTQRRRSRWGGARAGAGRPPAGLRASEPHKARPELVATRAVHVIARIEHGAARRIDLARAIARALERSHARDDFRIVHLAVRADRLDLIIEAADKHALARGMQGFQVSAARGVNRLARRTGRVFADRYRARILATRPALATAIAALERTRRA